MLGFVRKPKLCLFPRVTVSSCHFRRHLLVLTEGPLQKVSPACCAGHYQILCRCLPASLKPPTLQTLKPKYHYAQTYEPKSLNNAVPKINLKLRKIPKAHRSQIQLKAGHSSEACRCCRASLSSASAPERGEEYRHKKASEGLV